MKPKHHPHPETLVSYAAGTLSSAACCVVACHLSMCGTCAEQVRWLERLGGVMLSNLETEDADLALTERILAQRHDEWRPRQAARNPVAARRDDALLPLPLARYLSMEKTGICGKPGERARAQPSIALTEHSGAIRLVRLSPGQPLPEPDRALETDVALVLTGACRDSAGTYLRGDIIERGDGLPHPPTASGDAGCVCLLAAQTTG